MLLESNADLRVHALVWSWARAAVRTGPLVVPHEEVHDQCVDDALRDGPRNLRHAHGCRPRYGGKKLGVPVLIEHTVSGQDSVQRT